MCRRELDRAESEGTRNNVIIQDYKQVHCHYFMVFCYLSAVLLQGCQVSLNFSILLLKSHCCYWNFHEILAKILKFVLISQLFPHKNTEICVKLCKKLLQFVTEVSLQRSVALPAESHNTRPSWMIGGWGSVMISEVWYVFHFGHTTALFLLLF